VRPTQPVEIFGNVSTPSIDIQVKFYGDRPRGTPPSGKEGLNASDLGPIEGYISETVQDRR